MPCLSALETSLDKALCKSTDTLLTYYTFSEANIALISHPAIFLTGDVATGVGGDGEATKQTDEKLEHSQTKLSR